MAENYKKKTEANPVVEQIPDDLPPIDMTVLNDYNPEEAAQFARDFVQNVGQAKSQAENAYDAKKMERMAKGFSYEQQVAMARQFDHYALLEALNYQFLHLDELEKDVNMAFGKLRASREEVV